MIRMCVGDLLNASLGVISYSRWFSVDWPILEGWRNQRQPRGVLRCAAQRVPSTRQKSRFDGE